MKSSTWYELWKHWLRSSRKFEAFWRYGAKTYSYFPKWPNSWPNKGFYNECVFWSTEFGVLLHGSLRFIQSTFHIFDKYFNYGLNLAFFYREIVVKIEETIFKDKRKHEMNIDIRFYLFWLYGPLGRYTSSTMAHHIHISVTQYIMSIQQFLLLI